MNKIKQPCPFCGGEVHVNEYETFVCESCGARVRFPNSPRQKRNADNGLLIDNFDPEWHTALWNERSIPTCEGCANTDYNVSRVYRCETCARGLDDNYEEAYR